MAFYPRQNSMLSRLHTSKFSSTSFELANFICWCVKKKLSFFFLNKCTCSKASMIAFEQVHLSRKKLTHCRTYSFVRVDKENLTRKYWEIAGAQRSCFCDESWWVTVMADDNTAVNMAGRGTVNVRWTDSATSPLLECLRSRENLSNTTVESYRDRNKKAEHEEILQLLNKRWSSWFRCYHPERLAWRLCILVRKLEIIRNIPCWKKIDILR